MENLTPDERRLLLETFDHEITRISERENSFSHDYISAAELQSLHTRLLRLTELREKVRNL